MRLLDVVDYMGYKWLVYPREAEVVQYLRLNKKEMEEIADKFPLYSSVIPLMKESIIDDKKGISHLVFELGAIKNEFIDYSVAKRKRIAEMTVKSWFSEHKNVSISVFVNSYTCERLDIIVAVSVIGERYIANLNKMVEKHEIDKKRVIAEKQKRVNQALQKNS